MTTFAEMRQETSASSSMTYARDGVRIKSAQRDIKVALLSTVNELSPITNVLRGYSVIPERVNLHTPVGMRRSERLLGLGHPLVSVLTLPDDPIPRDIKDLFVRAQQRDPVSIYLGLKSRSEALLGHLSGASSVVHFDDSSGSGWQALAQHLHDPGRYPANTLLEDPQQQSLQQGEQ